MCFQILFQATVVCDLVLLYLLPKREFYKNMKFKYTDTQTQVRSIFKCKFCCNQTKHKMEAERLLVTLVRTDTVQT